MDDIFSTPYLSAGPFKSINIDWLRRVVGLETELKMDLELSASLT